MGEKVTKYELVRYVDKENRNDYDNYPCYLVRVLEDHYNHAGSLYFKMKNIPNLDNLYHAMIHTKYKFAPWATGAKIYSITKLDSQDYIPDINELWIYNEYSYEKPDEPLPDTVILKNRIAELEKEISEVKQSSHRHKTGAELAADYKARWKARM